MIVLLRRELSHTNPQGRKEIFEKEGDFESGNGQREIQPGETTGARKCSHDFATCYPGTNGGVASGERVLRNEQRMLMG